MTTARQIVEAQGGRWNGREAMCRCPAHDDKRASLSVKDDDGKILLYCFVCQDNGRVIDALKAKGLWDSNTDYVLHRRKSSPSRKPDNRILAQEIWNECFSIVGTVAERYLRLRAIKIPIPSDLAFHPSLKHPQGGAYPALVAAVRRTGEVAPVGIHRTYLTEDGRKADINPVKMSLGEINGGSVHLGEQGALFVTEGIEDGLSICEMLGVRVWACLGTSAMANMVLPTDTQSLHIIPDDDNAGWIAATRLMTRAIEGGIRANIVSLPSGAGDANNMLESMKGNGSK